MKTCYRLELNWEHRIVIREPEGQLDYEVHHEHRRGKRFVCRADSRLFSSSDFKDCMVFALDYAKKLVENDFK